MSIWRSRDFLLHCRLFTIGQDGGRIVSLFILKIVHKRLESTYFVIDGESKRLLKLLKYSRTMLSIAKRFFERLNIIVVLLLFVCVGNFVNCSFYDEKQSTEYTEAKLNITYCDTSGKKCFVKPYAGEGKFGMDSPKHGSSGWLYTLVENNVNGCKEFNINVDKNPWIALIERGVCNFKEKISNAYKHNATAVIIYDHEDREDEIIMSHANVDDIVAVSITKNLGEDLARALVNRTKAVYVEISVGDSYTNKWVNPASVLFVSVSFIVLMVISLAWLVFYYVQRFRYVHARDKTEVRNRHLKRENSMLIVYAI